MSAADLLPRAMFGGLLWGDSAVRYVIVDEAGSSAREPITIVAGLIVHADEHVMMAEAAVKEALGAVPEVFQDGFVFHATDVWGSKKYRDVWPLSDRLGLLKIMMGLPRRLGIPISLGMVRRSAFAPAIPGLSPAQTHHLMAFDYCLCTADKYIRQHAGVREVATVVAEDVPEMRRFLRMIPAIRRNSTFNFLPEHLMPTAQEVEQGYITQQTDMRITRIRQSIHFVDKQDDPLMQLADACAFGLRRFFCEQKFGEEFAMSMLGTIPNLADWAGPSSPGLFFKQTQK